MVISHDNGHLKLAVRYIGGLLLCLLLSHPHCRLGDTVKVDIVLTYELVNGRILAAPVILPLFAAPADAFEIGLCEGDRCPERLRPYPYRQPLNTVHNRRRYAPFDIAGETERNEGLACSVADTVLGEDAARLVTIRELCKLYRERWLLGLLEVFMFRHRIPA